MSEMDVENTPPNNTANREALIREKAQLLHRIARIDKILGTTNPGTDCKSTPSSQWDVSTREGQIRMMKVECIGAAGITSMFTWRNPILWTTLRNKEEVAAGQYDPYCKFKDLTRLFAEHSPTREPRWFEENTKKASVHWIAKYRSKIISAFREALKVQMNDFARVEIIPYDAKSATDLFIGDTPEGKATSIFVTCWKSALISIATRRANMELHCGRIRKKRSPVTVSTWSELHTYISTELESLLVRDTLIQHWKKNEVSTTMSKMITDWKLFKSTLSIMKDIRKIRNVSE